MSQRRSEALHHARVNRGLVYFGLSPFSLPLTSGGVRIERCLICLIVQNERRKVWRAYPHQKFYEVIEPILVLRTDEYDAAARQVPRDVLVIVYPGPVVQRIQRDRSLERPEPFGGLTHEFDVVGRENDDDAEAVVDCCRDEANHRDRFSALDTSVEETGAGSCRGIVGPAEPSAPISPTATSSA